VVFGADRDLRYHLSGQGVEHVDRLVVPARRHSSVPCGFSWSMSGLPPPGTCHFATTLRLAKSMTDTDPSRRLETYSDFVSRETCRPCAPRPVGMNWISFIAIGSTTETPIRP